MEMPVADICTDIPCNSGRVYCRDDNIVLLRPLHDSPDYFPTRTAFLLMWGLSHSTARRRNTGSEKNLIYLPVRPRPTGIGDNWRDRTENNSRHPHKDRSLPLPCPIVVHSGRGPTARVEFSCMSLQLIASAQWS